MAFAAVISVMHTIKRVITPTSPGIAKSAYDGLLSVCYTLKRLNHSKYRSIERGKINELDADIREAVYKLEDLLLQSYELYPTPLEDIINGVEQEIYSVLTILKELKHKYNKELDNPLPREDDDVIVSGPKKSTTVGLSDLSRRIKRQLLDRTDKLKIISVVGMAGIGKTHLVAQVYQDPLIVRNFEFRVWVRVGQKDMMCNALADIIAQIRREPTNLYINKSRLKLLGILKKRLYGRRYLIVFDDLWSTMVYNSCIQWLRAGGNNGRVLLTTRLQEVARNHCTNIHHMCFLDNEESWNLLRQNVFAGSSLSPQLARVGMKIAEKCEGLPLLILAVANILDEHEKTEEHWNKVANNKTTTFPDAYDQISKVLSLSYDDLPQHLKLCFLYMGVFPQRSEIPLRKLINLWTVEDFLDKGRLYLEDFSIECVEKIASNSLVIICNHSSRFMIKSFRLHSAYWYLCVKEATKNKFFHVVKNLSNASKEHTVNQRRFSIQNNVLLGMKAVYDSMAVASTMRTLLCTGPDHQYPVPIFFDFMFFNILDAVAIRFYDFPNQVAKLVQLRYLGLTHYGELRSSISNLRQLEYLILRKHHNIKGLRYSSCLPKEIWDMKELTHLHIMGSKLPHPSHGRKLPNLSKLYVNADSCTEDVFRSIPRLKKLGIKIELGPESGETVSCLQHIGLLGELESLKCVVVNPRLSCQVVAPPDQLNNFPRYLNKLCLNGLGFDWMHMSLIGLLPKLEVLKLRCSAFHGPKWETEHKGFPMLKYLLLEDLDVVQWRVRSLCLLSLEHLVIRRCFKLKEIPSLIGRNRTLKTMEVIDGSPSLEACVHKIQEERIYSLQLVIVSSWNLP